MKIRIIVMSLLSVMILNAKTINLDESIELFQKNNLSIKNISINDTIREVNTNELINSIEKDVKVSAKTSYSLEKLGIESKVTYKDAYVSFVNSDVSKDNIGVYVGYEKKINEFLFNTDKSKIYKNNLENKISTNTDKNQITELMKSFGEKYLSLLSTENSLKAKSVLLTQKKKEYEIAMIKEKNQTLNAYEVKVIRLNIEKLETEIKFLETEKQYKLKEFSDLIGVKEEFNLQNLETLEKFDYYIDNKEVDEIENNLLISQKELKELKINNLPEVTGALSYELVEADISASLSLVWYPLSYNGEEKSKELSIAKLKNQLLDAQNNKALKEIETKNSFEKEELNLKLSEKDIEIAKAELDKYTIMKNLGTVSEYDYYSKQKDLVDAELEYLNLKNSLNLNRKLENIYNSI